MEQQDKCWICQQPFDSERQRIAVMAAEGIPGFVRLHLGECEAEANRRRRAKEQRERAEGSEGKL